MPPLGPPDLVAPAIPAIRRSLLQVEGTRRIDHRRNHTSQALTGRPGPLDGAGRAVIEPLRHAGVFDRFFLLLMLRLIVRRAIERRRPTSGGRWVAPDCRSTCCPDADVTPSADPPRGPSRNRLDHDVVE